MPLKTDNGTYSVKLLRAIPLPSRRKSRPLPLSPSLLLSLSLALLAPVARPTFLIVPLLKYTLINIHYAIYITPREQRRRRTALYPRDYLRKPCPGVNANCVL